MSVSYSKAPAVSHLMVSKHFQQYARFFLSHVPERLSTLPSDVEISTRSTGAVILVTWNRQPGQNTIPVAVQIDIRGSEAVQEVDIV